NDFVTRHCRLAARERFLSGNRILLSEAFTREILERKLPVHEWSLFCWLNARIGGRINRWLPLIRFPDGDWRTAAPQRWEGAKTCNLSAWRADLLQVNGLDEV